MQTSRAAQEVSRRHLSSSPVRGRPHSMSKACHGAAPLACCSSHFQDLLQSKMLYLATYMAQVPPRYRDPLTCLEAPCQVTQ